MSQSDSTTLEQKIEAILFWKGEPLTVKDLSKFLGFNEESIKSALKDLEESLKTRGIVLIQKQDERSGGKNIEVMLGTSPECSALIEQITKDELSKDLGKASLETLAIILYKGPIKRSEIDYIRGVNSTFIIRNLLIRGLIEKTPAPGDMRASEYSASFELLAHLGLTKLDDLPDFASVQDEIKKFKDTNQESTNDQSREQSNKGGPVELGDERIGESDDQSDSLGEDDSITSEDSTISSV